MYVTKKMYTNGTFKTGAYGSNAKINIDPRIMTENVSAELVSIASEDTSAKSITLMGYLVFDYNHCGNLESSGVKVPVYREVYECSNVQ